MIKVSIIIATLNSCRNLAYTLNNISKQDYKNKEVIVIDGESKDGTIEIIKKYQKHISRWVSEKDQGIADAFNKGLAMASGDYIYFLGAGDYFWSNDVLEKMMENIDSEKDVLVCGKINRIAEKSNNVLYTSSLNFRKWHLLYRMGLPHQALFMNKKYFDKYGLFDENCKYSMDYELLLRSYKNFPRVVKKNIIVAAWREGGVGKDRTLDIFDEYKKIKLKNNIAPKIVINLIDIASRLNHFYKKIFHQS